MEHPSTPSIVPINPNGPESKAAYAADKAKIQARLRRIEGQTRGVQRMVQEDKYCVDILTQLSAIMSAVRQTGLLILEDHMRNCVMGTCSHGPHDQEELLSELSEAIERFTRVSG
jgi:CsoR family transcriptional regulator, copper-sensing transcriptional repressor